MVDLTFANHLYFVPTPIPFMKEPYSERRKRVLQMIEPGVLLLPSAPLYIRNNDVEHEYRQDSDLFYLTGFDEPESVLVLSTHGDKPFSLFVRPRDKEREVWDGPRAGMEGAVQTFGADAAFKITELAEQLPNHLENVTRLYYRFGRDRAFDEKVFAALDVVRARARKGVAFPTQFVDPATVLHELRRIKQAEELVLMERAAAISRDAHVAAMAAAQPGMFEYEIEAILRGIFRRRGAERPAYPPIVGSGPNATVLHYRANNRRMEEGDLLLIDAGCEFNYYASDVTRTFPVSGRFTEAQRQIYEIVLAAQEASIAATRPGATLEDIHAASVRAITEGLIGLEIIEGPLDDAIEKERYKPFFMHKTSHYLGMDVHDVGSYFIQGAHRPLDPGVVITIEPGIYVSARESLAPEPYRGIGIRIEDDVLVTETGHRLISDGVPRTVEEVERACAA